MSAYESECVHVFMCKFVLLWGMVTCACVPMCAVPPCVSMCVRMCGVYALCVCYYLHRAHWNNAQVLNKYFPIRVFMNLSRRGGGGTRAKPMQNGLSTRTVHET